MCGIAGMMRSDGQGASESVLRSMADTIEHRGPDGDGYLVEGPVGLAHRRLSIIDLAGSPQPMSTADGRFTIVFNGEILNYRELRETNQLPCRTQGDTEVLLQLLAAGGVEALTAVRGQFAFALFDRHDGSLLLARDRIGILPLFYSQQPWGFAFGSEPKALRPALGGLSLDQDSIADYLLQRFVPAPYTMYAEVRKVLPGGWLKVRNGQIEATGRYWRLDAPPAEQTFNADTVVDQFQALMKLAVDESLEADVPVGAYLSGGVDSCLTVALAAKSQRTSRLSTFTAGFSDNPHDERGHARRVSTLLGTDHHEVIVRPEDFFGDLQRLSWYRDLPISEPADTAVAALARLASEHVKVVISGEGSDELFGGYLKYRTAKLATAAGHIPNALRRPALSLARRTPLGRRGKLAIALRALDADNEIDRIRAWFSPFTPDEVVALCGRVPRSLAALVNLDGDAIRKFGLVDLASWLPDNLLERGDRMTMASSIELRPPFLDPRIIDFSLALPSEFKVRSGTTKWIVKEVAKRYVDADLIDRPKVGFTMPLDEWFRTSLRGEIRDLLCGTDSHVSQWLDAGEIRRLVDDHLAGRGQYAKQLWPLMSLEMWARHSLNGQRPTVSG